MYKIVSNMMGHLVSGMGQPMAQWINTENECQMPLAGSFSKYPLLLLMFIKLCGLFLVM